MENKTLQNINVKDIAPNPHNPRLIFEPRELDELKSSISKVGILVPLTVYKNEKSFPKEQYVILDGERRWRCAKELGFETIPANIIDEPKDITQNILFMFNIHHFRKEWALFPTALKLEVIIDKLGTDQESVLSEFTGVSRSTIRRCKALLWYPEKYRNVLMEKSGKVSTDFFIELYPLAQRISYEQNYQFPYGIEKFIDSCIEKFIEQKHFSDVKEFREIRKSLGFYDKNGNFPEFIKLIDRFVEDPNVGLEIFASTDVEEERSRKNILKYLSYLNSNLDSINTDLISDIFFEDQLKTLRNKIELILENIE